MAPEVIIKDYSWDETVASILIYCHIPHLRKNHENDIQCTFTEDSASVKISNINGKDYTLHLKKLGGEIVIEKCKVTVKNDSCVLRLQKKLHGELWGSPIDVKKIAEEELSELLEHIKFFGKKFVKNDPILAPEHIETFLEEIAAKGHLVVTPHNIPDSLLEQFEHTDPLKVIHFNIENDEVDGTNMMKLISKIHENAIYTAVEQFGCSFVDDKYFECSHVMKLLMPHIKHKIFSVWGYLRPANLHLLSPDIVLLGLMLPTTDDIIAVTKYNKLPFNAQVFALVFLTRVSPFLVHPLILPWKTQIMFYFHDVEDNDVRDVIASVNKMMGCRDSVPELHFLNCQLSFAGCLALCSMLTPAFDPIVEYMKYMSIIANSQQTGTPLPNEPPSSTPVDSTCTPLRKTRVSQVTLQLSLSPEDKRVIFEHFQYTGIVAHLL